jgi:hypothetical protein
MASPSDVLEDKAPLPANGKTVFTRGLEALGEEARPIDPEVERRVLRKIDLFLMPAMVIGVYIYFLILSATTNTEKDMVWFTTTRFGIFYRWRLLYTFGITQF